MGHKHLDSEIISDFATTDSQVSAKNRKSRSTSSSGSLFGDSDPGRDTSLASKSTSPAVLASSKSKPTELPPNPPNKSLAGPSSTPIASTLGKPIPVHLQRKLNPRVKPMVLPIPQSRGPLGISTKARISGLSKGNARPRSADKALSPPPPSVGNSLSTITSNAAPLDLSKASQPSASTEFDAARWLQENIVSTCDFFHKM